MMMMLSISRLLLVHLLLVIATKTGAAAASTGSTDNITVALIATIVILLAGILVTVIYFLVRRHLRNSRLRELELQSNQSLGSANRKDMSRSAGVDIQPQQQQQHRHQKIANVTDGGSQMMKTAATTVFSASLGRSVAERRGIQATAAIEDTAPARDNSVNSLERNSQDILHSNGALINGSTHHTLPRAASSISNSRSSPQLSRQTSALPPVPRVPTGVQNGGVAGGQASNSMVFSADNKYNSDCEILASPSKTPSSKSGRSIEVVDRISQSESILPQSQLHKLLDPSSTFSDKQQQQQQHQPQQGGTDGPESYATIPRTSERLGSTGIAAYSAAGPTKSVHSLAPTLPLSATHAQLVKSTYSLTPTSHSSVGNSIQNDAALGSSQPSIMDSPAVSGSPSKTPVASSSRSGISNPMPAPTVAPTRQMTLPTISQENSQLSEYSVSMIPPTMTYSQVPSQLNTAKGNSAIVSPSPPPPPTQQQQQQAEQMQQQQDLLLFQLLSSSSLTSDSSAAQAQVLAAAAVTGYPQYAAVSNAVQQFQNSQLARAQFLPITHAVGSQPLSNPTSVQFSTSPFIHSRPVLYNAGDTIVEGNAALMDPTYPGTGPARPIYTQTMAIQQQHPQQQQQQQQQQQSVFVNSPVPQFVPQFYITPGGQMQFPNGSVAYAYHPGFGPLPMQLPSPVTVNQPFFFSPSSLSPMPPSPILLEQQQQQQQPVPKILPGGRPEITSYMTIGEGYKTSSSITNDGTTTNEYTTTLTQIQTIISSQRELALPGFLMFNAETDISITKVLVKTGVGAVCLASIKSDEMRSRCPDNICVIKVLKKNGETSLEQSPEDVSVFSQEIAIMWFFRYHRNFAKLVGFANQPPTIAMKYYLRGSLQDFIYKDLFKPFRSSFMFCRLLKDISNGLREMHETGFVHCDVKPGNVLIDEDEKGLFAVLSDFGISRVVTSTVLLVEAFKLANNDGMSVAYASPEALKRLYQEEEQASVNVEELKANDVYSYSMVTYELITQQCPWPKELSYQDVVKRVLRGERPEIPAALKQKCSNDNILNGIVEIMIQCWSENQMNRLQMKWVAEILEQLSLIVEPDNGSPTINQDTIEQHGQSLATLNQDTVCAEQQQIN